MKKKYYFLFLALLFTGLLKAQTSTEQFETESVGSSSFTDNGVIFNIISHQATFDMYVLANAGWNGTAADNRFIDNTGTATAANTNPSLSIKTTSNLFKVNRFWVFVTNQFFNQNAVGTLTVTGKLSGVTKFTQTKTTGFVTSLGNTNGYTLIDLTNLNGQNYSNLVLDELMITIGGNYRYLGIDAFTWVKDSGTIPSNNPKVNAPANGGLINTDLPTYSGTAVANSDVSIYVDNLLVGKTAASSTGSWTFSAPTALSQGSHTLYATTQISGSTFNSVTNTFSVDSSRPSVVISSTAGLSGGSTSTSPIPCTVTFSETVTGFEAGDIIAGNATISDLSGSGTTYTFNATPRASGAVTINIPANIAQDAAVNGNTAANPFSITYGLAATATPIVVTPSNGVFITTTTPTYTGSAPAGSTVRVYVDGTVLGNTTIANNAGNWTIAQPSTLSEGSHTVYATAQTSGNALSANSNTNTFTVDSKRPSVLISSNAGSSGVSTGTSPILFTVTFSESVTGFVAGDLIPGNATISDFSGIGTTYTFNATPAGNGAVTISISANVALDAAGNGNTAATQFSINYTQTVTSTPVIASPSNGSLITTTTPDYTGTASAGATVTVYVDGASLGSIKATGGIWSLTQPTALAQGSHMVYATAQVTGNAVSINSSTNIFAVDTKRPSVVISSTAGASGGSTSTSPIPFTVTFSESVDGFVAGDLTSSNATISGFSGSGTTYTFNATPASNAAVTISIAANRAQDAAGNGNTAGTQFSITYGQTSIISSSATSFPSGLNTTYGTASSSTSVAVSGTGLSNSITATPSSTANFEVSADGTNYGTSAIIGTSGTISGNVYVRLKANAPAGSNITGNVSLTSTGSNTIVMSIPSSTVLKATLTYTSDVVSKTYGDAVSVLSGSVAGFVNGENLASATTGQIAWSTIASATSSVGSYAINGVGLSAINYDFVQATSNVAALSITSKTISVKAAAKSKTYGDADPALTYTFAPALIRTDTFTGSLTRSPGENVGTYSIDQGTLALNGNYTLTYLGADLTISTKTVTVTAAARSKTYGDADPALTYTFAPALGGTDTFTGSLTRSPGENVGTYAINQGTLALNGNYTLTYISKDLTIGAKIITVTATAKSKTYGDADPALAYTFAPALVGTDTFAGSLTRSPGENVGTYAINQGTLALNGNYTLTYVGADLTIGAKTVTVTAAAKSKTYGDADPALTYTIAPGLTGTDTFTGSLTRSLGENVGTYAINQGTLALNGNYTLTYIGADLTIGAKTITVTAAAKSKTYGDADPALTYTLAPVLVGTDSFSGSLTRSPGENVGTYAINQGTLKLNGNYTLTYIGSDLTISAKTVRVTAAAKSKTYGDGDPALTYTFAPALAGTDTFTGSLTRSPGENIGTYAINQATLRLNGNYTLTYVGADLTISAKTVTVTAAAKSKTYGDADPALTYTFAPALAGTDTFSGSLTRSTGENVGTYAINQATLRLNGNYTLTYVGADLTISAKTVTVAAAAKSKTYGDADPALTYTFAPALVGADTFTGSLTRSPGENIGTYSINRGTLALNGNYTLSYISNNLTIGARSITVTAAAKSKIYGDADPALNYTFTPALQTGDTFTGSLIRAQGENVGTYVINQGSLVLNSNNYSLTYINSNLRIEKAVLTVTANSAAICQSEVFPAFGTSYSGFKAGDTENSLDTKPTVSTIANRNLPGTYALIPSNGASGNYDFVYVNGSLLINTLPNASITSDKGDNISKGETAILTANGGVTYSWSTANGIISGQNTATLTIRPSQTTTYTVRITNSSGCSSTKSITITIAEDFKLLANNILTPNGDGVNDTWIVKNIDLYPENELRIIDRNGREMYRVKSYNNTWDGSSNGTQLAEGTYYYIITYGPGKFVQKGFITITRNR